MKYGRQETIVFLQKRDGFLCFLCKKPFAHGERPTVDHWIPRAAGGSEEFDNLHLMHKSCNTKKADLVPNPDGTLPKREKSNFRTRKNSKREILAGLCYRCDNGRKLGEGQVCYECGMEAGPFDAPHYLKRPSPQCDHDDYWCWACCIGLVERKSVMMKLIIG